MTPSAVTCHYLERASRTGNEDYKEERARTYVCVTHVFAAEEGNESVQWINAEKGETKEKRRV